MYHINYFLLEGHFAERIFLSGFSSQSPFKYDYDLNIVYADLNQNQKTLDFKRRLIVDVLESSGSESGSVIGGRFTETGVFEKIERKRKPYKHYSMFFEFGGYELRCESESPKYAQSDGKYMWVCQTFECQQNVELFDIEKNGRIWEWKNDKYESIQRETPTKVGNVLIHNLGYEDSSNLKGYVENFNGAMVGLELKTGHELWRTTFEYMVANYIDVDGRLILSTMGYLIELDPITGKELNRVDTDFPVAHSQGRKDMVAVYDIEDALLFISSVDKKLSVHDRRTLEQLQIINLPDSPASYGVDAKHKPIKFKDTWNLKVGAGYQNADRPSNDMLMQLTLCQPGEQASTNIEKKPPYKVTAIEEQEGQESYRIDLDAQTTDQLIRLAEVEVALIPGNHGNTMWGAPDKNPRFNGKIAFYGTLPSEISPAELNRAKGYLRLLVKHWQRVAEGDMGPYGSIPGTCIELSCFLNGEEV